MQKKLIAGVTFAASALAAAVVLAQPPEGGQRPEGRGRFVSLIVEVLDADKDGALSSEEVSKSADAIKTLDKDSDGKVSAEELRRPRPEGADSGDGGGRPPGGGTGGPGGRGRFVSPVVAAIDTDKDGALSAEEIAKAPEGLKSLDKDGDGKVSAEEMRPARPDGDRPQGDRPRN